MTEKMKRPELPSWVVFWNVNPEMRSGTQWVGTGWEFFDHEGCAKDRYKELNAQGHVASLRPYYPTDAQYLGAAHVTAREWADHFKELLSGWQKVNAPGDKTTEEDQNIIKELNKMPDPSIAKERDLLVAVVKEEGCPHGHIHCTQCADEQLVADLRAEIKVLKGRAWRARNMLRYAYLSSTEEAIDTSRAILNGDRDDG
jgi:hypothetical protein